jgi:hypothetical protein
MSSALLAATLSSTLDLTFLALITVCLSVPPGSLGTNELTMHSEHIAGVS